MDAQQANALPAVSMIATQEALMAYYPGTDVNVAKSSVYSPMLYAQCCFAHANGATEREIASQYGIPMSLLWRWASMPGLAEIWREVRKQYSYCVLMQAKEAAQELMKGYRTDPVSGQLRVLSKYEAAGLDRGGRLALEIATKLNPDEFAERLQVDKRQITTTYVVGLSPDMPIGGEADHQATIDVPAPDKAGVERANLPQTWREKLSRERRRKRESSNQDE